MSAGDKIQPIAHGPLDQIVKAVNDRLRQINLALGGGTTSGGVGGKQGSSAAPSAPAPVTPTAPNVVASVTTYALTQVGGVPYFQPVGTSITMPALDENYSHLAKISIRVLDGAVPVDTAATLAAPFTPDAYNKITWTGKVMAQAGIAKAYTLQFAVANEDGVESANPHTETLNVPAAVQLGPTLSLTGAPTGSEIGPAATDLTDQLQHTKLRVAATLTASLGNAVMSVWRSTDGAYAWYQAVGVIPFSGTGFSTSGIGDIDTLVQGSVVSCKFAIALGYAAANGGLIAAASLPANAVLSNAFNMAGIAAPSATGASGLSWTAPVYAGVNSNGDPYWTSTLTGNLPGVNDPAWFIAVTVECVDAAGNSDPGPDSNTLPASGTVNVTGTDVYWVSGERFNPSLTNANLGINIQGRHYVVDTYVDSGHLVVHTAHGNLTGASYWTLGGERLRGEWVNGVGGKLIEVNGTSATLTGSYNPSGSPYVYLRSRAWAVNRNATVVPGWKDPGAVLQTTCWPGGTSSQTIYFGDAPGQYSGMTMVVNPGFEQGFYGWQSIADRGLADPDIVGTGTTAPHSGNFCLRCAPTGVRGAAQYITCNPGKTLTYTAWAKSDGSPADSALIDISFYASDGTQIVYPAATQLAATSTWTQMQAVNVVPNGAKQARIQVYRGGTSGNWYFDDVQVSGPGGDATVQHNPNAVASSDGFQPGATTNPATNNPSTSILLDWDFSLSRLGAIPRIGGSQWAPLGDAQILNDADGNGNYCRLTGPNAEIMQTRGITAGQAFYFSCQMRSTNSTGTHSCTMYVTWLDGSNAVIGSRAAIGAGSGYLSAWTQGPAAWIVAPAKAAFAFVEFVTAETAGNGGHWDIGKVIVQVATNQTNSAITTTLVPTSSSNAYVGAVDSSTPGYAVVQSGGGKSNLTVINGTNIGFFSADVGTGGNGVLTISLRSAGGASYNGYTGAVAGRNCVAGIVV